MPDYLIIGAGTAGCIVAGELAHRGNSVCIIESGVSIRQQQASIRRPADYLRNFASSCDWNYATTPQKELAGRRIRWPRGRGEGGSGLINAMIYLEAPECDFVKWEQIAGPNWSAKQMKLRYATLRQCIGNSLEPLRFLSQTTRAIIDAATDLWGHGAIRPHEVLCRQGQRVTTADIFLNRDRVGDKLLRVFDQTVHKILFDEQAAIGVETSHGQRIIASRGVVLCAGTIGSPQLLRRSGIDSPAIGQNLQDHLVLPIVFETHARFRFPTFWRSSHRTAHRDLGRGPLVSNLAEASGLFGSLEHGFQIFVTPTHYLKHPAGDAPSAFTIAIVNARPKSRGELSRTDEIDPNYLGDPQDLQAFLEAEPLVRELSQHPRLATVRKAASRLPLVSERSIRRFAQTLYHPVGTCRMGSDEGSVVDSRLAVRGTERLWVADASVFPRLTTTNPQATVMAVAMAAIDFITESSHV